MLCSEQKVAARLADPGETNELNSKTTLKLWSGAT